MPKWSILIECNAENMPQLDGTFFEDDRWNIPHTMVIGIMKVEESDAK